MERDCKYRLRLLDIIPLIGLAEYISRTRGDYDDVIELERNHLQRAITTVSLMVYNIISVGSVYAGLASLTN